MRPMITTPTFLAEPLRVYVVTTQLGWMEEAKIESEQSLTLNIHAKENESLLEQVPATYLLKPIKLHQQRKDKLRTYLEDPEIFNAGTRVHCSSADCMIITTALGKY